MPRMLVLVEADLRRAATVDLNALDCVENAVLALATLADGAGQVFEA
jgi:hypothetical protein